MENQDARIEQEPPQISTIPRNLPQNDVIEIPRDFYCEQHNLPITNYCLECKKFVCDAEVNIVGIPTEETENFCGKLHYEQIISFSEYKERLEQVSKERAEMDAKIMQYCGIINELKAQNSQLLQKSTELQQINADLLQKNQELNKKLENFAKISKAGAIKPELLQTIENLAEKEKKATIQTQVTTALKPEKFALDAEFQDSLKYLEGKVVPQDLEKARKIMDKLAAKNHAPSLYFLGMMSTLNYFPKMDPENKAFCENAAKDAFDYFETQAKIGEPYCQFAYGYILEHGHGGIDKNYDKAVRYYNRAKDQDNFIALDQEGIGWSFF